MSAQLKQLMLDLITDEPGARLRVPLRFSRPEMGTKDAGVCRAVDRHCHGDYELFLLAIAAWPRREGRGYPVPAPSDWRPSEDSELSRAISAYDHLPHWEGEYGESRKDLCRWVITWLDQRGEQVHAKPVL